jgi:hypothetical protein
MSKLLVGYSEININPELNVAIEGYYVERFGKGFLDDLLSQVIAFSFDGKNYLWVSVDTCLIKKPVIELMLSAIEDRCNVPKTNILISATHSHTAPANYPTDMFIAPSAPVLNYQSFLVERVTSACEAALDNLLPARMGYSTGKAPSRIAYIRRYKMKDGSTMTCPPINDPDIVGPIGELDERVHILRFDREGRESIVVVNYGIHADTVNGELYSADFVGVLRDTVAKALDGVKCVFVCGAQGDVGSTNVHPTPSDMNDTEISFDNEMKSP